MPKCTAAQIEAELPKLREGGFKCAVAYLEIELRKRRTAKGKTATNDSPKHKSWREASRKYRETHPKVEVEPDDREIVPIDET